MALSLSSISIDTAIRAPRIFLNGREKIGKTTFAASAPKPVFLSIKGEQGTDGLGVAKFPTIESFTMLMDAIGVLYSEEHDYQTVVIDSVSTLEALVWQHVCKLANQPTIARVLGGYGNGFIEALKYWRDITDGLDALRETKNMTIILIGHVKTKTFDDPSASEPYEVWQSTLNDRAASALNQWADSTLFATTKVVSVKADGSSSVRGKETSGRLLLTQASPWHPGGGRNFYGQLPYEIPLSWEAFQAAIATASQNYNKVKAA